MLLFERVWAAHSGQTMLSTARSLNTGGCWVISRSTNKTISDHSRWIGVTIKLICTYWDQRLDAGKEAASVERNRFDYVRQDRRLQEMKTVQRQRWRNRDLNIYRIYVHDHQDIECNLNCINTYLSPLSRSASGANWSISVESSAVDLGVDCDIAHMMESGWWM